MHGGRPFFTNSTCCSCSKILCLVFSFIDSSATCPHISGYRGREKHAYRYPQRNGRTYREFRDYLKTDRALDRALTQRPSGAIRTAMKEFSARRCWHSVAGMPGLEYQRPFTPLFSNWDGNLRQWGMFRPYIRAGQRLPSSRTFGAYGAPADRHFMVHLSRANGK